ncbi:response regulator [Candidatus Parcubacteria bacterium]|nr:response regulator [Candidatus Parcubacteria bacterium]
MKKILLVEDEKLLKEMYKEKLVHAGFEVISASSAEQGLELIEKEEIDMVILDVLLPKENGIFFLKQQKNNPKISSIPVIVFSNYDDPDSRKQAEKCGVKAYLIKTNITPAELVGYVNKYL